MSKVKNLICCLIGSSDPFDCLSVFGTDFSSPRCLGSGVLAGVFRFGLRRVSRIRCFSFLSALSCFCYSFWPNVSDMSFCVLSDASVNAAL